MQSARPWKSAVGAFDINGDATCQVGVPSRALAFSGVGSAVGTVGVCQLTEAVLPPPLQGPGEDHHSSMHMCMHHG